MARVQISGTGLFTPKESISNEELVSSFNKFVDEYNESNKESIQKGEISALEKSNADFIEKASGVKSRYVQDKSGILDTSFMRPKLRERSENELSNLAEIGSIAARDAISNAKIDPDNIDAVIVACSSATFGIQNIYDMIKSGSIRSAVMINPEMCSGCLLYTSDAADE